METPIDLVPRERRANPPRDLPRWSSWPTIETEKLTAPKATALLAREEFRAATSAPGTCWQTATIPAPPQAVQDLLGNGDFKTTMNFTHILNRGTRAVHRSGPQVG